MFYNKTCAIYNTVRSRFIYNAHARPAMRAVHWSAAHTCNHSSNRRNRSNMCAHLSNCFGVKGGRLLDIWLLSTARVKSTRWHITSFTDSCVNFLLPARIHTRTQLFTYISIFWARHVFLDSRVCSLYEVAIELVVHASNVPKACTLGVVAGLVLHYTCTQTCWLLVEAGEGNT